ncbi:MAG: two-partner secretion domain-containing protein [Deferrisomatales bacterium]
MPTTYLISQELGQTRGGNLFHSFGAFDIVTGESAAFTGAAGIANIIGRVTGGGPSSIDGLLRSAIDGANLFLINPAGVMFGPNASLEVSGSFHASTADYLKFQGGEVFHADPAAPSVLSVAAPEAFGFLGARPAPISGENAFLRVAEGATLSLVGGEITYTGTSATPDEIVGMPAVLTAPGGRINLVSVASPGEVDLTSGDLGTGSFAELGRISFTQGAKLDVLSAGGALPGGTIVIRGGELLFQDGGMDVYGDPGGVVDIRGGSLHLDNYYVFPASFGETDHPGTAIEIDVTGELLMTHGALLDTQTVPFDPSTSSLSGNAGAIRISAGGVRLGDATIDENSYTSIGFYGYIASATAGTGTSGNITITAGDAIVRNGFFIQTQTFSEGNAGDITLHADTLELRDRGNIGAFASGFGQGGHVEVSARDILISAANAAGVTSSDNITGIIGLTEFFSNGGTVDVNAGTLRLADGGKISTVLLGSGAGADLGIQAENLSVAGFLEDQGTYFLSSVDARLFGPDATGTGGNIAIGAQTLRLSNGGTIRTSLAEGAPGEAGNVAIQAGDIRISDLGQIQADSFLGTGNSGNIDISAGSISITGTGGAPAPTPLDFDFTGMATTTSAGRGGAITVSLAGDLSLAARGGIKADTQGSGPGGKIEVSARNVTLTGAASINAASTGTGNAGDIALTAADTVTLRQSSVTTEASADADGGNIAVNAPNRIVLVDSKITSSVGGGPQTAGGNITIDPEFVVLRNSQIVANAFAGTGGNIRIVAGVFLVDPLSRVDASSALGVSGTVDIQAPINNVSGVVGPLSTDFTSATALLRERCLARIRAGKYSSFVVGGRDGLPIEPGNLLPSLPR